jgi:CBS domain containing-hemolysin-like protein
MPQQNQPSSNAAAALKAIKSHLDRTQSQKSSEGMSERRYSGDPSMQPPAFVTTTSTSSYSTGMHPTTALSDSLHGDEVIMIEGALQMKTSVAIDVYTPLRKMFAIPEDLQLRERAMVQIYASGYSRVPVYRPNPSKPKDKTAVIGILLTKQLIVLNASDGRSVSSMPLYTPMCVSPQTPLVELINLFQTGGETRRGGHLALVCARPQLGNDALAKGDPLPEKAGLLGVITLEDVIENLLQEQIYDENDRYERDASRLGRKVVTHWRRYVRHKKEGHPLVPPPPRTTTGTPHMADVVEDVMEATESSGLLSNQL